MFISVISPSGFTFADMRNFDVVVLSAVSTLCVAVNVTEYSYCSTPISFFSME